MTTMLATDNATLVRNALELGEPSVFAPDYTFHGPPEIYEADCPSARGGSPIMADSPFDAGEMHVEDIAATDDRVVVRFGETCLHRRKYRGVAPSGRTRAARVLAIYRIEDGRIAEGWGTVSWD